MVIKLYIAKGESMQIGTLVQFKSVTPVSMGVIVEIEEKYRPEYGTDEGDVVKYLVEWMEGSWWVLRGKYFSENSLEKVA